MTQKWVDVRWESVEMWVRWESVVKWAVMEEKRGWVGRGGDVCEVGGCAGVGGGEAGEKVDGCSGVCEVGDGEGWQVGGCAEVGGGKHEKVDGCEVADGGCGESVVEVECEERGCVCEVGRGEYGASVEGRKDEGARSSLSLPLSVDKQSETGTSTTDVAQLINEIIKEDESVSTETI